MIQLNTLKGEVILDHPIGPHVIIRTLMRVKVLEMRCDKAAKVGVIHVENGGGGHKPGNVSDLQKPGKAREQTLPWRPQKE